MKLRKFDDLLHEKLRDPEFAALYIETALKDGGIDEFLYAIREVTIAQKGGVQVVAAKTKHGRESLYKSLNKGGNPHVRTLNDVLHAVGLRISVACETTSATCVETEFATA